MVPSVQKISTGNMYLSCMGPFINYICMSTFYLGGYPLLYIMICNEKKVRLNHSPPRFQLNLGVSSGNECSFTLFIVKAVLYIGGLRSTLPHAITYQLDTELYSGPKVQS